MEKAIHSLSPTTFNKLPDSELFHQTCAYLSHPRLASKGVGTLNEKTIHAVLKHYYAPNPLYHEIKVDSYVADVLIDHHILEVQTRHFHTLHKKLDAFLPHYHVTIVYPIASTKWVCWIDEETGEITSKRRSPKKGALYAIMPELYRIKNYLTHPHLHFILTFMDVEEYRLLNGWSQDKKRGSSRHDGIPTELVGEVHLNTLADYMQFLPDTLPAIFTSKDYMKCAKVTSKVAGTALNILHFLGIVSRVGKKGNAFLYERVSLEQLSTQTIKKETIC